MGNAENLLELFGSKNICSFDSNICNFCSSTKYCVKPIDKNIKLEKNLDLDYSKLVEKITEEIIRNFKDK